MNSFNGIESEKESSERDTWGKREREEGILKRSAHLNGNSEYADARADATHMLIK